ncbi:MAG TPA: hypothetical protein VK348_13465 [Planctomycetota bacterium]|nr:hypothetical protein [Planctomycetota bacterium]
MGPAGYRMADARQAGGRGDFPAVRHDEPRPWRKLVARTLCWRTICPWLNLTRPVVGRNIAALLPDDSGRSFLLSLDTVQYRDENWLRCWYCSSDAGVMVVDRPPAALPPGIKGAA